MCDSPFYVLPKTGTQKVPVPCGRCPPCKNRRVNGWVFRLLEEEKVSSSAHFVTLTYNTSSVPISPNGYMTLFKRDLQLYFKRLRKLVPSARIKYYAVGEYGSQNNRPHYHAIVFNVPTASLFFEAWVVDGVPIGGVHVGHVTSDSVAYTLKYIDKPHMRRLHERDDRIREFSVMSKGLGKSYLTSSVVAFHRADLQRLYLVRPGGHRVSMPKYYRDKIYTDRERRYQALIAQNISDNAEVDAREKFRLLYGDNVHFDFEQWKIEQKYGRYEKFYRIQKQRNI